MKLFSSKTVKSLMLIAFIFSNLALLADSNRVFDGKVIEIAEEEEGNAKLRTSAYLKFPGMGGAWILWIIQPDSYVKEGTLLIHTDPTFVLIDIDKAKVRVNTQALILMETKRDMERCRRLVKTKSVSPKDTEDSEIAYYRALLGYEIAKKDLKKAELDLEYVDIKAPYDCYVDKVYGKVASSSNIDFPALKILRLSPLYVEVKLDRPLAKKIYNQEIGISVYPLEEDKPVGVINEKIVLTEDGIRLPVRNYVLIDHDTDIPIIRDISYVSSFKSSESTIGQDNLGILEHAFYKDSEGTYVWKAVGQKALLPGKMIDTEFSVKKIYVNKTKEKREGFDGKLYKIENTDKLQINDVLIKNAQENLKDGDKVTYKKRVWLFWPGDKVKVVLSDTANNINKNMTN